MIAEHTAFTAVWAPVLEMDALVATGAATWGLVMRELLRRMVGAAYHASVDVDHGVSGGPALTAKGPATPYRGGSKEEGDREALPAIWGLAAIPTRVREHKECHMCSIVSVGDQAAWMVRMRLTGW